jgi:hypothetical protein
MIDGKILYCGVNEGNARQAENIIARVIREVESG